MATQQPSASLVTPSKPPPPVDISTIEAAKENIVPLHSGRSASQLAALSSSTRSGLGVKLDAEHARFAVQIAAVEAYEQTGTWEDGKDGLSAEEVQMMAEDPLDINHQYVRFIVANYPAGASAANKLVPVLEATTRKFLGDLRYTNDPRYFRLWAHYAKNMENPEDCYRFLFAKGVGEKLAALYEEYAKVLEAKYKRKQADQVYNLGINRRATPLDRLKRSYLDFQARMLVAPPVPSPPQPSAPSSGGESRSILSSSTSTRTAGTGSSVGGTGVGPKGNGSMFAVFRDDAGSSSAGGNEAGWEDFGTVKSRQRENNEEKKEWAGEVMLQKGAAAPKIEGFKLEVYRDETASAAPSLSSSHGASDVDVFSRSSRPTSEAELLRSNPFKNYSASDVDLLTRDPLEGLEVLPRASSSSSKVRSGSSSMERKEKERLSGHSRSKSGGSSHRSLSSSQKPSSSSSTPASTSQSASSKPSASTGEKPKERVAVSLRLLYPAPGEEYSFEELKAKSRREKYVVEDVERWNGWEWREKWEAEVVNRGMRTYKVDGETGWPALYGEDGAPLYDFLPRPSPPTPEPAPAPVPVEAASSLAPNSPSRPSSQPTHSLLSPSPPALAAHDSLASLIPASPTARNAVQPPSAEDTRSGSPTPEPEQGDESSFASLDPNRPPSPTMNTRAANALLDHLFAKTLDFTKVNRTAKYNASDDDDDSDEPSTDEDEEEPSFGGVPGAPGAESQFSTQGAATQQSQEPSGVDSMFVPFSQTRSQMGDDSGWGASQHPGSQMYAAAPSLGALVEEEDDEKNSSDATGMGENNENALSSASRPSQQPLQLFRDPSAPSPAIVPATPSGAFRPVTKTAGSSARAPLGMKSGTPLAMQPPKQPLFSVFSDQPAGSSAVGEGLGDLDVIPSSQPGERENSLAASSFGSSGGDSSFAEQDEFEAPLTGGLDSDEDDHLLNANDGYNLGRRLPGQSRYAPFVQQMTPIVERTLEFTAMTSLSTSQRSRRDSYYPTGAAAGDLKEEDEEDEEDEEPSTDEEEGENGGSGDRAFVASFASQPPPAGQMSASLDVGDDSSFQSGSSSSDTDSDDDEAPLPSQQQQLPFLPPPPSQPLSPTHLNGDAVAQSSPTADSRSFDVSLSNALVDGLTIAGNQSGMTTNMLVGDASLTIAGNQSGMTTNMLVGDASTAGRPSDTPSSVAPVNPFDRAVLASLLAQASSSILDNPDVSDLRTETADRLADLQRVAKKRQRVSGGKDKTGVIEEAWDLELNGEVFSVREKLGEGTFGAVFRVALTGADEDDFDVDAEDELSLAVKVEKPTNLWEFHVLNQLHCRLSERARASVVSAQRLYAYKDESFLFLDYCDRGSLLDAVNCAHESGVAAPSIGVGLDEILAIFFVIELLRAIEGFHSAGFIHGDLKIDNCLLRLDDVPGGARAWSSTYDPTGANGWSAKGIKLIDFGRTIDVSAYPAGQTFAADFVADGSDCAEMREGRSWTYEPDYYGVAGIAFNILFGRNIETKKDEETGKWSVNVTWKRYYQEEMWTRLFGALLNPKSVREDGALPITDELAIVRTEMEEYLRENGEKAGKSLRGLIKKLEIYSMSR
ncbi:hypothetical protein JCM11251_001715 [Rhodosporidiobolus azoricus]